MRTTSLTFSIAASLLLLGFAGQASAVPPCPVNKPDFTTSVNRSNQWNNSVANLLSGNPWPNWAQFKQNFEIEQCKTAWRGLIGITRRSCKLTAPSPTVSGVPGTTINYLATSNPANRAILKLEGCGRLPVQLPAELEK